MRRPGELEAFVEHFRLRVLQDALQEATSDYWERRARAFAAVGTEACDEIARACEAAAQVALIQTNPDLDACCRQLLAEAGGAA